MGVSLLTMGAGNVVVLKETFESFCFMVDEIIYGDMLLFEEDREVLDSYHKYWNLKSIKLPFNYIYKNGFSSVLNYLSSFASNDIVLYMNTSEVTDDQFPFFNANNILSDNPDCNAFYFIHHQERHRWFRLYDRRELKWHGLIHEELQGDYRPYHKPIFMMKDLEKDMHDPFKAKVLNSAKECVYWNQLIKIADNPELLDGTSPGWLQFAKDTYQSMKDRLAEKGRQVEAYETGDLELFLQSVHDPKFKKLTFESTNAIAFQGNKIHLL